MTPKATNFVLAYLSNGRDEKAAYETVYGRPGPHAAMLARKDVQRAIADHDNPPAPHDFTTDPASPKVTAAAERIVQDWVDIYTADPRDLITHRRVNCRHCNGVNHKYQFVDPAELVAAAAHAMKTAGGNQKVMETLMPTGEGGYGFRANGPVHPECPHCYGEGISDVFIADFRKLTPQTLKLLAGVKVTKTGIEVLMHDQMKARELHAKVLGMLIDRTKSEDEPLPPPPVALTPEQIESLAKLLGQKY